MIDIGVGSHDDNVTTIPPQLVHLLSRHWQVGCGAETFRPVLRIGRERARLIGMPEGHQCFFRGLWHRLEKLVEGDEFAIQSEFAVAHCGVDEDAAILKNDIRLLHVRIHHVSQRTAHDGFQVQ